MPYTGIVLAILAVHVAAFLILLGHWLVSAGLFPKVVEKFVEQYETRPIRATLLGLVTYGPLFLILLNAGKLGNPVLTMVGLVGGFGGLLIAFVGSAGIALLIGRNLRREADAWAQGLRGSVVLALVFITPLLGSLFLSIRSTEPRRVERWTFRLRRGFSARQATAASGVPWARRAA